MMAPNTMYAIPSKGGTIQLLVKKYSLIKYGFKYVIMVLRILLLVLVVVSSIMVVNNVVVVVVSVLSIESMINCCGCCCRIVGIEFSFKDNDSNNFFGWNHSIIMGAY